MDPCLQSCEGFSWEVLPSWKTSLTSPNPRLMFVIHMAVYCSRAFNVLWHKTFFVWKTVWYDWILSLSDHILSTSFLSWLYHNLFIFSSHFCEKDWILLLLFALLSVIALRAQFMEFFPLEELSKGFECFINYRNYASTNYREFNIWFGCFENKGKVIGLWSSVGGSPILCIWDVIR